MGQRPAKCYRTPVKHAYTRTAKRVVKKAFIRGVPGLKLIHLDMGTSGQKYKYMVVLTTKNAVQIRNNALEACRIVINRTITEKIGKENFHFQIRVYPHHVLRENALISGAGADRLQTGMSHAFGRPIGKAARVKKNQIIFSVKVNTKAHAQAATVALKKVVAKLPTKCAIETREIE